MITYSRVLFVFALCMSVVFGRAQSVSKSDNEAKALLKQAGQSFLNLDSKQSLDFAKASLEIALKNNNFLLASKAYNLIGLNFDEFSDPQKAIDFYKKGIQMALRTDNDTIKSWLYNNLGNVYCYRKIDFLKGIANYREGIKYSEKMNDAQEIVFSKLNIGSAYFSIQEFDKGIIYLKPIEHYIDKEGSIEAKISLNSNFGLYYSALGNFKKSEDYYLKALKFCDQNDVELIKSNVSVVYDDISKLYFKLKDYEKAYFYLAKHDALQDKIYNEDRLNEVKVEGLKIDYAEVNRKIEEIEKEKQNQAEKLKTNTFIVVLLIILFFVLLLLLFSLIRNNKIKAKANVALQNANQELLIAKEKAEEASQLKSQFVSTISHELRTPLYGVVGITDIILEEHKELQNSPHLKSLKFSAKYLLSLVNDILKVYKIEENQVVLEDVIFKLQEQVEVIKDSLRFLAIKNNNDIEIVYDPLIPEFLVGDKTRLSQILINLISNSLKFTTNGKVVIKVELLERKDSKCILQFQIIDNGIGIAKQNQEKVFEKFVQIYRKEDDYQGTGLGLTIVKKMIELFKGTILLESEENVGTTITFTIAFDADITKIPSRSSASYFPFSPDKGYKILIVEDNKINQVVTKKFLENHGFICIVVENGYEAVELVKDTLFDIILMDINMPLINGFETSKLMRQNGITTPIIAITAFDKQEIEDKIESAQINEVIVKPFDSEKLFEVLNRYIK